MEKLRILVAHTQPGIVCATARILEAYGFGVERLADGDAVARALDAGAWDGLVIDTALPGTPVHDLIAVAKECEPPVPVILIGALFRRSSFKRRPGQLYGADDVVDVHRIAEELPAKLWRLFTGKDPAVAALAEAEMAFWSLHHEPPGADGLAALLVAGAVLDRADEVVEVDEPAALAALLSQELEAARALLASVMGGHAHDAAIERAFHALIQPVGEGAAT